MNKLSLSEILNEVRWHQKWEISPGVFTPGVNPVAELMNFADVPLDLTGKRVLDIGAWNGCFSFECERRGAAEVLAIGPETAAATGFDKTRDFLSSNVQYRQGTIYHLQPDEIGHFDIVLCFGVIYHLRYPLLAFDMIRRVCSNELFIETAAIENNTIIKGEHFVLNEINPKLRDISLLQFYRGAELNNDPSNWFSFNAKCVEEMLLSSGFRPSLMTVFDHRVAGRATVIPGFPEWFQGSGEGVYYDVITRPILGSPDVY